MAELETTTEFDGEMAVLVLSALCCLPLGFFYYVSKKEPKWICPECRETVNRGASTCRHCDADLGHYE